MPRINALVDEESNKILKIYQVMNDYTTKDVAINALLKEFDGMKKQ